MTTQAFNGTVPQKACHPYQNRDELNFPNNVRMPEKTEASLET